MTIFYLVRHGKTEKQAGDSPLTALGQAEALTTAEYLNTKSIRVVYSSPLSRCRETAAVIAAECEVPLLEDERLRERANWGDLPGQSREEFVAMWEQGSQDRYFVPPVGDSAHQAGARFEVMLKTISQQYLRAAVAVVTHGGVMTDFLHNMYVSEHLSRYNRNYLHMPECAITMLQYNGRRFEIMQLASTAHLTDDSR